MSPAASVDGAEIDACVRVRLGAAGKFAGEPCRKTVTLFVAELLLAMSRSPSPSKSPTTTSRGLPVVAPPPKAALGVGGKTPGALAKNTPIVLLPLLAQTMSASP